MICEAMFRMRKDGVPYSNCFCSEPEKIENYDKAIADKEHMWDCHHRAEICYTKQELIERGDYFNVPACNLIFLTRSEHKQLHYKYDENYNKNISKSMQGHKVSEETKRRMAEKRKLYWEKRRSFSNKKY